MWIEYNSHTVQDIRPIQEICYLKNYDEKSTDPSMVQETLRITGSIAAGGQ
jgi:hypothetical protein